MLSKSLTNPQWDKLKLCSSLDAFDFVNNKVLAISRNFLSYNALFSLPYTYDPNTLGESVVLYSYTVNDKGLSWVFILSARFDYEKVIRAYDRYLQFRENYQCQCCNDFMEEAQPIEELKQFLDDSILLNNAIMAFDNFPAVDKQYHISLRSLINSIKTGDPRIITHTMILQLTIIDDVYNSCELGPEMIILLTRPDLDIKYALDVDLPEQYYNEDAKPFIIPPKSNRKNKVVYSIGAGFLFEMSVRNKVHRVSKL